MKQKIILLSGPTAVGKSALAVEIAKRFNGEIVSVDSMQIYRGLDIGTGKITPSETDGIAHHLLDIKNPNQEYSVSEFVDDCKACIKRISSSKKIPVLAGGTGLYFNALLNNYNFAESPKSEVIRAELVGELEEKGNLALHEKLQAIDFESAKKISPNDSKRIIRALEIYYVTGKTKSEQAVKQKNSDFDYLFFILNDERNKLYENINSRVEKMFCKGLVEEVKGLMEYKNCQSMQAIGYKEVVDYLENNLDLNAVKDKIKQNSRNYAKRQLTYLRWLDANKIWTDFANKKQIFEKISDFLV